MKKILLACIAVSAALALTASANDSRYRTYVPGIRAAGMGGVAGAFGTGLDATANNPATLADAEGDSISVSANIYGLQHRQVSSAFIPDDDISSSATISIPSTFGGVLRLSDRLVLAFSIIQPETETVRDLSAKSNGDHLYTLRVDDDTTWAGPSIAYLLDDHWSLGASLFGVYRSTAYSYSIFASEANYTASQSFTGDSFEGLAVVGARYVTDDDWYFGASLQTPTLHLYDSGKFAGYFTDEPSAYDSDVEGENRIPARLILGAGRQVAKSYAFGLDLIFHPSMSYEQEVYHINGHRAASRISRDAVLDFSLGGEYYITKKYPIRAGIYSAFASTRDITDDAEEATEDVDVYGATLSIGRETDTTAVTIGLNYAYGHGRDCTNIPSDDGYSTCATTLNHIYLTLSTSYFF